MRGMRNCLLKYAIYGLRDVFMYAGMEEAERGKRISDVERSLISGNAWEWNGLTQWKHITP